MLKDSQKYFKLRRNKILVENRLIWGTFQKQA